MIKWYRKPENSSVSGRCIAVIVGACCFGGSCCDK